MKQKPACYRGGGECACILHVRVSSRCVPACGARIRGGWAPRSSAAARPADAPRRRPRRSPSGSRRRPRAPTRRCRPSAAAAARTLRSCDQHTHMCPHGYLYSTQQWLWRADRPFVVRVYVNGDGMKCFLSASVPWRRLLYLFLRRYTSNILNFANKSNKRVLRLRWKAKNKTDYRFHNSWNRRCTAGTYPF